MLLSPPRSPLFPYTTLFRSGLADDDPGFPIDLAVVEERQSVIGNVDDHVRIAEVARYPAPALHVHDDRVDRIGGRAMRLFLDRKSTRLNSSHPSISYAVFCL